MKSFFFVCLFLCCFVSARSNKIQGAYVSTPNADDLPFRWGNNPGYYGGYWDDAKVTTISARAGFDSQRKKLPEQHLQNWGYGIEVGDCKHCNNVGVYDLVGYLATPSEDHSTKRVQNSENCPPANMYEPIFLPNGDVNPNNYWAAYINKTVHTYKNWVRIWEVWNEPDYTDWRIPPTWLENPPTRGQLSHWNGDIFEYNRIMRITYEVVKKIDPTAWVAVGGLGYTEFLDAMLRYSDNPTDGSLTDDFPSLGGAWFDCLSYHKYPMWGTTDVETGISHNKKGSDDLALNFVALKKNMHLTLKKYGFCKGCKYPEKLYINSETAVGSSTTDEKVGSPGARRGYILKMPLYAMEYDIKQTHWFVVSDGKGKTVWDTMGDFKPIGSKTTETAILKESSMGRVTLHNLGISHMLFHHELTAAFRDILNATNPGLQGAVLYYDNRTNWPFFPNGNFTRPHDRVYAAWMYADEEEIDKKTKIKFNFTEPMNMVSWNGKVKIMNKKTFSAYINSYPTFFFCDNCTSEPLFNSAFRHITLASLLSLFLFVFFLLF